MADKVTSGGRVLLRTVAKIGRWLWIGTLSILLLAGMFFHAPWKVVGLIAVFLLACTALPRRRRKYFWATVGVVILALAVWVFLPDDSKGWRPYVFEKETEAFLAKYRVPAEENAALAYESLCRRWEKDDPNEPNVPYDWYEKTRNGPWRREEYPEIAAWLDYHKVTVVRLLEAARLKECFFEDDLRRWLLPPSNLPPLAPMRQLSFLLETAANRDWGERGLAAAIEKQLACLRFSEHISRQPDGLFVVTGQGMKSSALRQLNRAIVDDAMESTHLELVANAVSSIPDDWRSTFAGILENDKLYNKNLFSRIMYQVNDADRIRRSRDPWGLVRSQMESTPDSNEFPDEQAARDFHRTLFPGYWQKRAGKAWLIASWFISRHGSPSPEKMSEIIDKAYEKYSPMLDPGFKKHGEPQSFLSIFQGMDWQRADRDFAYTVEATTAIHEETYNNHHSSFRRADTARRGTLAMVALRRYKNDHGSWPQSLESAQPYGKDLLVVDAWDRPFVYRLEGDGFMLYSMGENGLDENGQHKIEYSDDYATTTIVADDWPIWPPRGQSPEPEQKSEEK